MISNKENLCDNLRNENKIQYSLSNKTFIHSVVEGVKTNHVSSADILTTSLVLSAKKKKRENLPSSPLKPSSFSKVKFDLRKGGSFKDSDERDSPISTTFSPLHDTDQNNSNELKTRYEYDATQSLSPNNIEEPISDAHETNRIESSTSSDIPKDQLISLRERAGKAVLFQILNVLNYGSYDEITSLRGIGKRRADKLMELRKEGIILRSSFDLEQIRMSERMVRKFVESNLVKFIELDEI